MLNIFLIIFFITIGVVLFTFNKKIVCYEINRRSRSDQNVDERLIKTQIYIASAFTLIIGLWNLGWLTGFFGK